MTAFLFPVLGIFALYTGYKLWQIFQTKKVWAVLLTLLIFAAMVGAQFLSRQPGWGQLPFGLGPVIIWTGDIIIGLWATFFLLALIADIIFVVAVRWSTSIKKENLSLERRAFFTRRLPTGLLGASGVMAGIGLEKAIAGPRIQEVLIPLESLPPTLQELKIVQISDLHVGPTIQRRYVEELVATVESLSPDLVMMTGDLGDGHPQELAPHLLPLKKLRPPLGAFYVTGNHEYYWGVDAWIEAARDLGFEPLLDSNHVISYKGLKVLIAGVTDTSAPQFDARHVSDPQQAMRGGEHCDFKILLAHRPESCFVAAKAGFHLQLSGHTHAGQFFPFSLFMPFAHKYYRGLNRHENLWVYVNRGSGYWGPPNRFAVPTEVTLLRLTKS